MLCRFLFLIQHRSQEDSCAALCTSEQIHYAKSEDQERLQNSSASHPESSYRILSHGRIVRALSNSLNALGARAGADQRDGLMLLAELASAGLLSLRHTSASGLGSINPVLLNSPSVVLGSSSQLKQYDLGFLKVTCFCHRRMRNQKSLTNK